jgi:hypothetical protein
MVARLCRPPSHWKGPLLASRNPALQRFRGTGAYEFREGLHVFSVLICYMQMFVPLVEYYVEQAL